MTLNLKKREIHLKLVYYGPPLSGKTTNILYIAHHFPGRKGDLVSLSTEGERTLVFDFLPLEVKTVPGFTSRFHLYTVPGQALYRTIRRVVLKGADGVIFVADSAPDRKEENRKAWEELQETLRAFRIQDAPIVIQYNKRDLPDAVPLETLQGLLNPRREHPEEEAVALQGIGVFPTLQKAMRAVLHRVVENFHRLRSSAL